MAELAWRSDLAAEDCWDLTTLFASEAEYLSALSNLSELAEEFTQRYAAGVSVLSQTELIAAVYAYEEIMAAFDVCENYAFLAASVDAEDAEAAERELRFAALAAELSASLSFFETALQSLPAEQLDALAREDAGHKVFFEDLARLAAHKLSPAEERLLCQLEPALSLPKTIYERCKLADMDFASFELNGRVYPLSFTLYENNYASEADTALRRTAFAHFSAKLEQYKHTMAAAYFAHVQRDKLEADLRSYASVFDYLLAGQNVPRELYERQLQQVMRELAPHMRRYAELVRRAYGLEKLQYADLLLSLDTSDSRISISEAKRDVLEALSVLGPDYRALVEQAYAERRIDFPQNKGKMTGGFCASPYAKGSYILMNWNGKISEVMTLAHELGHLGHFALCQQEQTYLSSECSLYLVEAPSTFNELLLTRYYLQNKAAENPQLRKQVLAGLVGDTYFHNFVTHFLEAVYQHRVYERVDAGEILLAADFSEIFRGVLAEFWGDSVELEAGAELVWMRQPHYYSGLYSYTYSAGLSIATAQYLRMAEQPEQAVQAWLQSLKAGGTFAPVDFAAALGLDIAQPDSLSTAIAFIGSLVDELAALS